MNPVPTAALEPVAAECMPPARRSRLRAPVVAARVGAALLVALLAALDARAGVGWTGWLVGLASGAFLTLVMVTGVRADRGSLGPADTLTYGRSLLGCGVAALAAQGLAGPPHTWAVLVLAVPALLLDAVDGPVARHTDTVSAFGGRFDGEVDAFAILALSVVAAQSVGWWVLPVGLARYVFGVAGWILPWLRRPLDFRYWRKVVTAAVDVALVVAIAGTGPSAVAGAASVLALALLAESFGRDVLWLWRRRSQPLVPTPTGLRPMAIAVAGVAAAALAWFALLSPTRPDQVVPLAFARLPAEAVVGAAALVLLPRRGRRLAGPALGVGLALLVVSKALDLGAYAVLDRPYNPVTDAGELRAAYGVVRDTVGAWAAAGLLLAVLLLVCGAVASLGWAGIRLSRMPIPPRRRTLRIVVVAAVGWGLLAISGLRVAPGVPVASAGVGPYAAGKVRATAHAVRDRERFAALVAAAQDTWHPGPDDLLALRGKDVLLVFVESYGRVALSGPRTQPVRDLLDAFTVRLAESGLDARSGYLSSPTFGGKSWLAHGTLESGLWISDQGRYDALLRSDRATLISTFRRTGWRTVGVLPSTRGAWPEVKAFYRFDSVYDGARLGYRGPRFSFSAMPDQFTLAAFDRLELSRPGRPPVMAQIELTSSHTPWAPLPTMVDWNALGDGSVFGPIAARATTPARLWHDPGAVPAAYETSIAYSLSSILGFLERRRDDDLVAIILGDHQPATIVSGYGGNRDVPVTVVARDPAVVGRIADWGWTAGVRPRDDAPVWRMDAFRDRFLRAFSGAAAAPG